MPDAFVKRSAKIVAPDLVIIAIMDYQPPDEARRVNDLLVQERGSVTYLADRIGRPRQSVSEWLSGKTKPLDPGVWDQMLEALGVTLDPVRIAPMVRLPLIGAASAGDGLTHGDADEQYFSVPVQFGFPDYAAAFVDGDSMMPLLQPGDYAIFREQTQPRDGYVYALRVDGGLVVKRLRFRDGRWIMESTNELYPATPLPRDHKVLGLLVGFYRSDDDGEMYRHKRGGLRPD